MRYEAHSKTSFVFSMTLLCFVSIFSLTWYSTAFAQESTASIREVRSIETDDFGIFHPTGLSFSPSPDILYVLPQNQPSPQEADISLLTLTEDRMGSVGITARIKAPINMTFDPKVKSLLIIESVKDMLEFDLNNGTLSPTTPVRHDIRHFGLKDPQGMTVDPDNGHLFILDAGDLRIVQVESNPGGGFDNARITSIDLQTLGLVNPRGLALDPTTGHFHVLSIGEKLLYELTPPGQLVMSRDMSAFKLNAPQGIVFAPSGDLTDDPAEFSLYIADSGLTPSGEVSRNTSQNGQVMELSIIEDEDLISVIRAAVTATATLIQTIDTSLFVFPPGSPNAGSPVPSPDPAGVAYIEHKNRLLVADSEVEEEVPPPPDPPPPPDCPYFRGYNLFDITIADPATLFDTMATLDYSNEPTGLGYNPFNMHLFISDDDKDEIFEVDPGSNGNYDDGDDTVTSFDTRAFGSQDPEGVTYDSSQGVLFIADELNNEVYRIIPGPNGKFDGPPPSGDDYVRHFDASGTGLTVLEGITIDTDNGLLYLGGNPADKIYQVTKDGALVREIDVTAANAVKPAGLAYAPSTGGLNEMSIYITDRGLDNNPYPCANDGKVYEMAIPPYSGNLPPTVDAGPNQTIILPVNMVSLDGTVTDDGDPMPPGTVTKSWSKVLGPGTVTFNNATAEDTEATFSDAGVYILSLTASDSEFASTDETFVTVIDPTIIDIRVAASLDDAEESFFGAMRLSSNDLDLVESTPGDPDTRQTVGMRFSAVNIPQGATIDNAYVQFQVDTANTITTILTIEGEDVDNALSFENTPYNISNIVVRPRTEARIENWSPNSWLTVGEAGPDQQTPDISSIIQEIVDRPGWTSGNALVIIITGTGARIAKSYDGDANGAPLLHVEFTNNTSVSECAGDYDTVDDPIDGDVDGKDLYKIAAGINPMDLSDFANEYGRTDCFNPNP